MRNVRYSSVSLSAFRRWRSSSVIQVCPRFVSVDEVAQLIGGDLPTPVFAADGVDRHCYKALSRHGQVGPLERICSKWLMSTGRSTVSVFQMISRSTKSLDSTFVKRLPVGPLFGRLSSSGLCPFPVSSGDSGLAEYQRE